MKRILKTYLFGAGVVALAFSFKVQTAFATCTAMPTCSELGYSLTACATGEVPVYCPFNTSYKYCLPTSFCDEQLYTFATCPEGATCASCKGKYAVKSCNSGYELNSILTCSPATYYCGAAQVGDYYYNDDKCSSGSKPVRSDKTVIGIVVDPERRVAVELAERLSYWDNGSGSYQDIPDLNNYASATAARNDMDGESNTQIILNYANSSFTLHGAAQSCNNIVASGKHYYLPAAGELYNMKNNFSTINNAIISAGGTTMGSRRYWSSTEQSAQIVYAVYPYNGNMTASAKNNSFYERCFFSY